MRGERIGTSARRPRWTNNFYPDRNAHRWPRRASARMTRPERSGRATRPGGDRLGVVGVAAVPLNAGTVVTSTATPTTARVPRHSSVRAGLPVRSQVSTTEHGTDGVLRSCPRHLDDDHRATSDLAVGRRGRTERLIGRRRPHADGVGRAGETWLACFGRTSTKYCCQTGRNGTASSSRRRLPIVIPSVARGNLMNEQAGQISTEANLTSASICLSGGGKRAALFSLGSVWAVHDSTTDALTIQSVSSVSGSGLVNAFLAARGTLEQPSDFACEAERCFKELTFHTHRFATWHLFLLFTIAVWWTLDKTVFAAPSDDEPLNNTNGAIVFAALLAAILLVVLVSFVVAWAARTGAHRLVIWLSVGRMGRGPLQGRWPRVSTLGTEVLHEWHTTELVAGTPIILSSAGTYAPDETFALDPTLAQAVRASAAFPGVFRHVTLRTDQRRWPRSALSSSRLRLADGGLYNNLATSGLSEFFPQREWRTVERLADLVIVADAGSDPPPLRDIRTEGLCYRLRRLWSNVMARTYKGVLFASYHAHHTLLRELLSVYEELSATGEIGPEVLHVRASESPLEHCERLSRSQNQDHAHRAAQLQALLLRNHDRGWWDDLKAVTAAERTDLSYVQAQTAASVALRI